ncbi:hypothetical protein EMIHUDRAFT_198644 [Emiliania huxleyi CCMP1516]|uniref:Uncharacterized protein n=2 Tax=Emiliania huxleyi TaxID=2903 RepID=A0A0D3I7M5_EMIH1|nr:hypothetical protein EMIHUDRAFT_198644 [Emiliania huxleyi CCMP1516]EOD07260.1 hypothetical protein EMIHUDRAFT_198644 [Emiliania huxleyi CCMP1516]|eukprot:XP_005759689.1 hypothetical protein EMIHUDRAFT_198644 [Emiliania huxleyi CCMP1516]
MTMMIQRVNANSPAQAVKSRARGPTITQLRAKQAALVAASELAASSDAEASVVRHSPVDEAKRWASGKGRKVGFAKARATFRGGGTGIAATAAKHDSLIKKARWRGTALRWAWHWTATIVGARHSLATAITSEAAQAGACAL